MTFQLFALRGIRAGARNDFSRNSCPFHNARSRGDHPFAALARANRTRMVAKWRVNAETGRLECSWMRDSEPGSGDGLPRMIERLGIALAIHQQNRLAA